MKRDTLRLVLALTILVGLAGFLSWHRKKTFQSNEAEDAAKKLVTIDTNAVTKIAVTTPEGKVVFERRPKNAKGDYTDRFAPLSEEFDSIPEWAIVSPFSSLPDYHAVTTLLSNVKEIESTKKIDEKGENLSSYNLEKPPLVIELYEKGATPKVTVRVGDQNSAKSGVYLQTSTAPEIVLSDNTLEYLKNRKMDEWRKKEIIGIKEISGVQKVVAAYDDKGKKSDIVVVRTADGWALERPQALPADKSGVESWISDIKTLRANSVVSDDPDKDGKQYGFDKPYAKIDITIKGAKETVKTILIGSKFEKDHDIYIRRADYPQIFSVRNGLKASLTKDVPALVDKTPLRVDRFNVTGISISRPDKKAVELKKTDGKWRLSQPADDLADESKISAFLAGATEFKAETYLGANLPATSGKNIATIRLTAGDKTKELSLYAGKDDKDMYGKSAGLAYRFTKSNYASVLENVDDFRDRRMTPVETSELASIQIEKGKMKVSYIRSKDEKWVLGTVEGVEPPVRAKMREPSKAEEVVTVVGDLKIETFLDTAPATVQAPEMKIELRPKSGESMIWAVREKSGSDVIVQSDQRKVVGKIDAGRLKPLEDLFQADTSKKG